MKISLAIISLFFFLCPCRSMAQQESHEQIMNRIVRCLESSDSRAISLLFNSTVDIGFPDKDNTYSASQAEMVMREFFKKDPPRSCNIDQQGQQGEGTRYAIGTYLTENNKYQVFILIRQQDDDWAIHKLKFDKK